ARCSATRRTSVDNDSLPQFATGAQLAEECQEDVRLPRSIVAVAVDEEGRSAVDAAARAGEEIRSDALGDVLGVQVTLKSRHIEIALLGVFEEMLVVEEPLVLVQEVVHRPEGVLQRSGLGGTRGAESARMGLRQREVAEGEEQVVAQSLLERFDNAVRLAAVGTLVIAVLHQLDRRIAAALHVVPCTERWLESAHWFLRWRLSS